jgi:hypothetical protein
LAALAAQSIACDLEVVMVGPRGAATNLPSELTGEFADFVSVDYVGDKLGRAVELGMRAATSPVVWLTEDHCFPEPGCAVAILERFEEDSVAAVGPTVINGNPRTLTSWTQFVIEYGTYSPCGEKGSSRQIPGHNSAYRVSALEQFDNLDRWFEVETLLHWEMNQRGMTLINASEPTTRHFNASRWYGGLRFCWLFSRTFAAYRSAAMPESRIRLALLWPLIPVVRFRRLWPLAVRLVGWRRAVLIGPNLLANLIVSGIGEGIGYITGTAAPFEKTFELEFHRDRFFSDADSFPDAQQLRLAKVTSQLAGSGS